MIKVANLNSRLKSFSKLSVAGLVFAISATASAQSFKGTFSATTQERLTHKAQFARMTDITTQCMQREYNKHLSFYRQHGVSAFYGSNSSFKRLSVQGRRDFLRRIGKNPALADQMKQTSCVGFAMDCFREGFNATGQAAVWTRINRYMGQNNYDGSAMLDALRHLGWKVYYWNPDPSQNAKWDASEKARKSVNDGRWGYHAYRYSTVRNSKKYYKNHIDDGTSLVGFGARTPNLISQAPLFIGIAHAGYHVFPGFKGYIIESHSTRDVRDQYTLEADYFNPLTARGAPRGQYYSGLVALPPQ